MSAWGTSRRPPGTSGRPRAGTRALALLAVFALTAVACGTRRSHQDVVAAAGGGGRLATSAGGVSQGDSLGADQSGDQNAATGQSANGVGAQSATGGAATGAASGGTGPGKGQAAQAGGSATKSTIHIGVVGTLSGVAGASLGPQADGVRIWARWINDRGGVNGHPVDVVVGDDGGDPSRHQALVQEFVEQKNVVAFVGDPEVLTGQGSVPYLTKAGVAVVGSDGGGQWFYQSPVYFPQGSTGNALAQSATLGIATEARRRGFTKVATITCVEAQICRDSYNKAKAGFARYGLQVVYQSQNSLGQPDFTAECLNAKGAGAQIITTGMDANSVKNIARSCARQGYHPMITLTTGQTTTDLKDDPDLEGALVTSLVAPWVGSGSPSIKDFQDAAAKYAPGTPVAGGTMIGWVSGMVFAYGAKALPEPPTRQAVVAGLQAIHGDVLPDLTGPLLFNKGAPATPTVCGFNVIIHGGAFTADAKRTCVDYDPSL